MEKRQKITQYREKLDKTLTSPDLTTEENLKALVTNQLLRSSEHETEGCNENVIERRTAEVSNFLDMLRSASRNRNDSRKASGMGHPEWKIKQDDEEFRVMYCEGPKGTPYHSLLVEGFVDGPVDVCLCVSWESELYKKWWPQILVPTFKILSSECLQKVRMGEQISLVRVKVSWPLSTREVVVHYFLFEYFQDDLIIVLLNSISDIDSIDISTHGFTSKGIPKAEDVVRIDVVGGFAIQKVTENRSYFRTIANMDMKLDFVPPSLINFVSRQLIGNGFRLYQKVVTSTFNSDNDFLKALKGSLYTHINEALYLKNEQNGILEEKDLSVASDQIAHRFPEEQQKKLTEDRKVHDSYHVNEPVQAVLPIEEPKASGEIEEEESQGSRHFEEDDQGQDRANAFGEIEEEESKESKHFEEDARYEDNNITKNISETCQVNGHRISVISPEVEKALETLDEIITMVRKCGLKSDTRMTAYLTDEKPPDIDKVIEKNSSSLEESKIHKRIEFSVSTSKKENGERVSDELHRTSSTHSSRHVGSNSMSKEVNHNKIVPASPEQKFPPPRPVDVINRVTSSVEHRTTENLTFDQNSFHRHNQLSNKANGITEINQDVWKKSVRNRKNRYWCFPGSPIRLKKGS